MLIYKTVNNILFLFIWQDAQHQDMDIGQRVGEMPALHAVADTAAILVIAIITGRTLIRPLTRQELVQSAGAAAETQEA